VISLWHLLCRTKKSEPCFCGFLPSYSSATDLVLLSYAIIRSQSSLFTRS